MLDDLDSKIFLPMPKKFNEGQPIPLLALIHFRGMNLSLFMSIVPVVRLSRVCTPTYAIFLIRGFSKESLLFIGHDIAMEFR